MSRDVLKRPPAHGQDGADGHRRHRSAHPGERELAERVGLRRAVLLALMLGVAACLVWLGAAVLAPGGWTALKLALLLCLAANAPWLGLSAATGLIGFCVRIGARDSACAVFPALRLVRPDQAVTLRTAIAVCVRDEAVAPVFARLAQLGADIDHAGLSGRFSLCVLSDTASDALAESETREAACLRAACATPVLYRRRAANTGFKAGNVMSFLDEHAGAFDLLVCLDADSEMTAPAILRLVRVMQADPRLAIVQATFHGQPASALFPRLFQFGQLQGLRIWAVGQAWWQADSGPYWGHNAVVRVAPFRAHCRLSPLPDGAAIMSHDHVEAALLQGAGWRLRVLACDEGSSEAQPPTLPDYLVRDRRWAAGNLQYRFLLRRRELGRLGRLQMLQAILHYALTPLWFAMLPLAALNAATGGAAQLRWGRLLTLLAFGWLTLHAPKLLGMLELLLRPAVASRFGGRACVLRLAASELVFAQLFDPIIALHKTAGVLRLAAGAPGSWTGQTRDEHAIGWSRAAGMFWPHTLAGIALAAVFAAASPAALLVCLPAVAGLMLAIPFAVFSSKQSKALFFEKKKQKTFGRAVADG